MFDSDLLPFRNPSISLYICNDNINTFSSSCMNFLVIEAARKKDKITVLSQCYSHHGGQSYAVININIGWIVSPFKLVPPTYLPTLVSQISLYFITFSKDIIRVKRSVS